MLNLFNLRRLAWPAGKDWQQKVVLSNTEVESLRSEVSDLEEREAHIKARLEHIDEILRSARLSGYDCLEKLEGMKQSCTKRL